MDPIDADQGKSRMFERVRDLNRGMAVALGHGMFHQAGAGIAHPGSWSSAALLELTS